VRDTLRKLKEEEKINKVRKYYVDKAGKKGKFGTLNMTKTYYIHLV